MTLTPIQIALLALAHATHQLVNTPGSRECVAVWGSWETAARVLTEEALLIALGTERSARALEWRTLHGRHRRGRAGRLVHLYRLAPAGIPLAARCAYAVAHMPNGYATWRNVPAELPAPRSGARCPSCGCVPDKPCRIVLAGGCGEAGCTPAGVCGLTRCSACLPRAA